MTKIYKSGIYVLPILFATVMALYLFFVRGRCIEFVRNEIIGTTGYRVVSAHICSRPGFSNALIPLGWEVSVEPVGPVLDGGFPFYFTLNGTFLDVSGRDCLRKMDM